MSVPTPREGPRRPPPWLLLVWPLVGFMSAVCGIGGGLFAVPALHYLVGLSLRRAVGTSLVLVLVLAITATVSEALRADSALDPRIVGALVLGAVVGARAGFWVAQRIQARMLKRVFAVALLLAAVRIFGSSGGVDEGPVVLGALRLAGIAAVGLGGGFLAPLLGIGGGLVVVPALYLGIDTIDYLDARASSLAMSIVTAGQSALMYLRAGEVELSLAAWLAGSTALGAVAGVTLVHRPGWADHARTLMAVILVLVAVRFALDALRRPVPAAETTDQA